MTIRFILILMSVTLLYSHPSFALQNPKFTRPVPKDVLAGTNMETVDDYFKSIEAFAFPAEFSTDTGGSTLTLKIEKKGQKFLVERGSHSPGEPKKLKKYTDLNLKNEGCWLTGKDVELVKVHGGALILEYDSGVEGIPHDLWFFYESP